MGRSDDSITRRKNKRSKSKQEEKNAVSNRIAAIIAAKKRRHTGKRRQCQGMCYSLPTEEDPYNDRSAKTDPFKKRKRTMKNENKQSKSKKRSLENIQTNSDDEQEQEQRKPKPSTINLPSNYLIVCLETIQDKLEKEKISRIQDEKSFVCADWGMKFWKAYIDGEDVLEKSSDEARVEQIAWIGSTASDCISKQEEDCGETQEGPFLLYLVQSQEKAAKIRKIFKPLKIRGVHSVIVHSGSPIEHQVNGLKKCEPEILVCTPDRLWEIVEKHDFDISGVSLLVLDTLKELSDAGFDEALKSIRAKITGDLRTVVFGNC